MKRSFVLCVLSLTSLLVTACSQEPPVSRTETSAAPAVAGAMAKGTVTETMNSGGYTYVQVDTGGEKVWAAAPECLVKVGDQVIVPEGAPMQNYHSKTLDRDFEVVYFVSSILDNSGVALPTTVHAPSGHPHTKGGTAPAPIDVSGIERPEGGKTVAELFAEKAELAGKEVTLRGKVAKFNAQIMGKNWLHVQDGTGDAAAGTHDLTLTTDVTAKVGDTVLVQGVVVLDRDFGFGYKYDVMIEDAKITVE